MSGLINSIPFNSCTRSTPMTFAKVTCVVIGQDDTSNLGYVESMSPKQGAVLIIPSFFLGIKFEMPLHIKGYLFTNTCLLKFW